MTAFLFGGMLLFSAGFAPFLFSALPAETVRGTIRKAFPPFYLFVIAAAGLGAALSYSADSLTAILLAAIAVTTIPNRQILMPAINDAADAGNKARFGALHGLSVAITLAHIVLAGVALARFLD
ncbi:MAG: DUF4149 domain-containing protein [Pseudomonadota bacterium]